MCGEKNVKSCSIARVFDNSLRGNHASEFSALEIFLADAVDVLNTADKHED